MKDALGERSKQRYTTSRPPFFSEGRGALVKEEKDDLQNLGETSPPLERKTQTAVNKRDGKNGIRMQNTVAAPGASQKTGEVSLTGGETFIITGL